MDHGAPSRSGGAELSVLVRPRAVQRYEWLALSILTIAGIALGAIGARGSVWGRTSDSLELLYPHFPAAASPGTRWELMLARVLLPLIAGYATLRFIFSFYSTRLRLLRLRHRTGHAVVYGLSAAGLQAGLTLVRAGERVVAVEQDPLRPEVQTAVGEGITVLVAHRAPPELLHSVSIRRARQLVCATDDEALNVRAALFARQHVRAGRLTIHARVARPELVDVVDGSGVECFDLYDIWARNLLEASPLARPEDLVVAPQLVVIGGGPLARALLLTAARLWHFHARADGLSERLHLVLVADNASDVCARFGTEYVAAQRTSLIEGVDWDAAQSLDVRRLIDRNRKIAMVFCVEDGALNQALGRSAAREFAAVSDVDVLVAIERSTEEPMPGPASGIRTVSPEGVEGFRFERFSRREELARSLHTVYLNEAERSAGRPAVAVAAFDALSPAEQASNRRQAEDIPRQLDAVLCRLVPIRDWDELLEFEPDEVEVMAQLEHIRWAQARVDDGWRQGPIRDDPNRLHPDLVPWSMLREPVQELNRAFVRARPSLVGRVGCAVERDPIREAIAAGVHARYRELLEADGQSVPTWDGLDDHSRAKSRAFVAAIPSALVAIGCRVAPLPSASATLTDREIETLSVAAHEVWAGHRTTSDQRRDGMPVDEEADPDRVPWEQLLDDRREIDRALVRHIPALLESAGYAVARLPTVFAGDEPPPLLEAAASSEATLTR